MTELILGRNRLDDVSALSGMVELVVLNLSVNEVWDVAPLAGLARLEQLMLEWNNVTHGVASLASLGEAARISFEYNDHMPCTDLDTLVGALGQAVVLPPGSCLD